MPSSPTNSDVEPFPAIDPTPAGNDSTLPSDDNSAVPNRKAASSSLSGRLRNVSATFERSSLPEGFLAATSGIAASMMSSPTTAQARRSSASSSLTHQPSNNDAVGRRPTFPAVAEETAHTEKHEGTQEPAAMTQETGVLSGTEPFANGYHFPPKHTFAQATSLSLRAFWAYFLTPIGFLVTIYGLNVVAWGGMLFLLLCNASPAMCHPSCNDINSPRRKWIEWDSQILNALFCVTGFGLAPWRFRDLYFLLQYRLGKKDLALRKLAAIHRGWFRLPGSTELPQQLGPGNVADYPSSESSLALPFPESKIPDTPLTGVRAPATRLWKLDAVIWLMVSNTFLQCVLCGFMWGMNRYNRPSWATGLFVGLACVVAGIGGYMMFLDGKKVKSIEGVPVSEADRQQLEADRERGVMHYNNINDENAARKAEEKAKKEAKKKAKK